MEIGRWTKSATSNTNGACVEVLYSGGEIFVRDTKDRSKELTFTVAEWEAFLDGAKSGEFDL